MRGDMPSVIPPHGIGCGRCLRLRLTSGFAFNDSPRLRTARKTSPSCPDLSVVGALLVLGVWRLELRYRRTKKPRRQLPARSFVRIETTNPMREFCVVSNPFMVGNPLTRILPNTDLSSSKIGSGDLRLNKQAPPHQRLTDRRSLWLDLRTVHLAENKLVAIRAERIAIYAGGVRRVTGNGGR